MHAFFKTYYHPANASLSLAGDIETGEAFELAERFFGDLRAGPGAGAGSRPTRGSPRAATCCSKIASSCRALYLSWHSPAMFAPDDAELDVMADVLAHGKTSRLYRVAGVRAAHRDRRVGASAVARDRRRVPGGLHGRRGRGAAGIAHRRPRHDRRASRATARPSSSSSARSLRPRRNFIYRLQTIGGFGGKSDQLNAYNVYRGDPGYFEADRKRYRDVTAGGVAAAARRWLLEPPLVTLSVVPRGRRELALPGAVEVSVS